MAFLVEDGTGLPDATSYASVEGADAYFSDRQNTVWSAMEVGDKQAHLIIATDYIDLRYGTKFPGQVLAVTQALGFPRINTNGMDRVIPQLLVRACFEYAVRAAGDSLAPDLQTTNGLVTFVKEKKIGPMEYTYGTPSSGTGSRVSAYPLYPVPDGLMDRLLGVTQMNGRVIR